MPRKRKAARPFRAEKKQSTHELIRALIDDSLPPDTGSPILSAVPESERAAIVAEAWEVHFEERAERRRPILIERLENWPPETWGMVFAEQPQIEDELTEAQSARWQVWRTGVERRQKRETQSNVVLMKTN